MTGHFLSLTKSLLHPLEGYLRGKKISFTAHLLIGTLLTVMTVFGSQGKSGSGLPIPRFVSLRAKVANLHVGPGKEYPSKWRYVVSGIPLEIVAEFDVWRKVRDPDGVTEGWILGSLLCSKRTVMVQEDKCPLRETPDESSAPRALLGVFVVGKVSECNAQWCRLTVKGQKGWVKRAHIWGVYPTEDRFK